MLVVLSLFLPWFVGPPLQCLAAPCPGAARITAWTAFRFADVLLVVMAIAVLFGVRMAAIIEHRLLGALVALAGWCGAAGSIYAVAHPDPGFRPLIARETTYPVATVTDIGYFVCLVACGAIAIGGLLTALARPPGGREDLL